jgi:hypothetical protein
MEIDKELVAALEDLDLEPLAISDGQSIEDSLTAGYSMPEGAASVGPPPFCCCSCCC